jgi:hypothetical protein
MHYFYSLNTYSAVTHYLYLETFITLRYTIVIPQVQYKIKTNQSEQGTNIKCLIFNSDVMRGMWCIFSPSVSNLTHTKTDSVNQGCVMTLINPRLFPPTFNSMLTVHHYTARSESRCAFTKGVGSDVHEGIYSKTESNNHTLYRYCTSTAV